MIDIHSHIIANVDDGANDIEESIEMLKRARLHGTEKIVLTPHYRLGIGDKTIDELNIHIEELKEKVKLENINIELYLGQEIFYTEHLLKDLEYKKIGPINNTKYILLELPQGEKFNERIIEDIYELKLKGIVTIIAHPERYLYFQKNPNLINKLIYEDCLFQLNSGSILGKHGRVVKKLSEYYIKNNLYSFIGSDAHGHLKRRTGIKEATEFIKTINLDLGNSLKVNGEKMLNNLDIDAVEEIPPMKFIMKILSKLS